MSLKSNIKREFESWTSAVAASEANLVIKRHELLSQMMEAAKRLPNCGFPIKPTYEQMLITLIILEEFALKPQGESK